MTVLGQQPAMLAAVTTGVGYMMCRVGMARGRLVLRQGNRRCQSCGRRLESRLCPHCG